MDDTVINSTAVPITPDYFSPVAFQIGLWSNTAIFMIGLITNPIMLYLLLKKQTFGSSIKILLVSLTLADLGSIVAAIFINYIPYYWKWFNVFSSDLSCGVANTLHGSVNTMSSWYLVLIAAERFTAVCFPNKVTQVFSPKKTLVACLAIPAICLVVYSVFILFMGTVPDPATGYILCVPKKFVTESFEAAAVFKVMIQVWVTLYMFLPALIVLGLSSTTVIKLHTDGKLGETLVYHKIKSGEANAKKVTKKDKKKKKDAKSLSENLSKRVCTRLAVVCSVLFVILILPRGFSVSIFLDANWTYSCKAEYVFDVFSYILQYINHSMKLFFFLYATK